MLFLTAALASVFVAAPNAPAATAGDVQPAPLLDPMAPPPPPLPPPPAEATATLPYTEAMAGALQELRLARAEVEIVNTSSDQPETYTRLVKKYGEARLVVLARTTTQGSDAVPQTEPSVVTTDARGRYVLLRAQAVEQIVYNRVDNCIGVRGAHADPTVHLTLAVLPKGRRLARTVVVPYLKVVVVTQRPRECATIP